MAENPLQINFSESKNGLPDNQLRKEAFLKHKTLTNIGERDPNHRQLIFSEDALKAMTNYTLSNRTIELAGVLTGFYQGDQTFITQFIPAPEAQGTGGTVTFNPEAWGSVNKRIDEFNISHGTNDEIVAWFHSHPHDYPPSPYSSHDQFIMRSYFNGNDRTGTDDKATVIMTTFTKEAKPSVAVWKWDDKTNEAVYVHGISIAQEKRSRIPSSYYEPTHNEQRIGSHNEFISVDVAPDEMNVVGEDISIIDDPEKNTLTISITDESKPPIKITLHDNHPDPTILRISHDDLSPETQEIITRRLKKHPGSKGAGLLQRILDALSTTEKPNVTITPVTTRRERNLVDEIKIISED